MLCEKKNLNLHPMNAKKVHLIYIIGLLSTFLVGACCSDEMTLSRPGRPGETLSRTLVIYMAGENSLSTYLQNDSLEIAWGIDSLPENTRVVLYMDDTKSTRLCVGAPGTPLQTVKSYDSNLCSTNSATMAYVLQDIFATYPAETYGLIMCSHASGWLFDDPTTRSADTTAAPGGPRRSFGIDNGQRSGSNSGPKLNIPALAGVLAGCPHLDFLMFDACFMQCIEVAYELRNVADYIIASPAEIPAPGAPYNQMLRSLCTAPTDIDAIVHSYTDYYYSGWMSQSYGGAELTAIRTDLLPLLARSTAPLLRSLLAGRNELNLDYVQRYFPTLSSGIYPAYIDLKNLFYHYLDAANYASWVRIFDATVPVQSLSPQWYSAFGSSRFQSVTDINHCGGVSVYVPRSRHQTYGWVSDYHGLEWYEATGLSSTYW